MVGSQQQAVLHATANNDNAISVAADRGLVVMRDAIERYTKGQRLARGSQWMGVGAALLSVGTAIAADQLIGWTLAATIVLLSSSLWFACQTIFTLYELAKIQREHIDFLERIKLGDGN